MVPELRKTETQLHLQESALEKYVKSKSLEFNEHFTQLKRLFTMSVFLLDTLTRSSPYETCACRKNCSARNVSAQRNFLEFLNLYDLVVRVPGCRHRGPGIYSRRYQIE
jgi:hypothetical protein